MDREAKDQWQKAIKQLVGLNETLSSLLKAANQSRQHNKETTEQADGTSNPDDSSGGEPFFSLYFWPRPKHTNNSKGKWYKSFTGWKSLIESIAFIAAIVYAGIAYRQWRDAADNFKADQRAWIAPKGAEMIEPLAQGSGANQEFQVVYINTGKEPATNASERYSVQSIPSSQLDDPEFIRTLDSADMCHGKSPSMDGRSGLTIFQGDGVGIKSTFRFPVEPDHISGRQSEIFNMCVTYRTVKEVHHTSFCYYYRNRNTHGLTWSICKAGNHAD